MLRFRVLGASFSILGASFSRFGCFVLRSSFSSASFSKLPDPGARFSKVPIINGPGKLSPFTLKIEVSIVFHLT